MQANLPHRFGLNVPNEWWAAAPLLKEIEAAGFSAVQVPSPPSSVLTAPGHLARHAAALAESLDTTRLRCVIHAPASTRAGTLEGARTLTALLDYAAGCGATHVVYHAANLIDEPGSQDELLAETRSLAALAKRAETVGVTIALENLAPVFPGPDALSFAPMTLRTMAKRIGSPAVGLCIDVGHANVVAGLRGTDPIELIEPALDGAVLFHLHDNLGARRTGEAPAELDPIRLDLHLPPGRGTVPWSRLAPLLTRRDAPLIFEIHPPQRPKAAKLFEAATAALEPPPVPAPAYT